MKNLLLILAFVFAVTLSVPAQSVDKKDVKKETTTKVVDNKTTKKDMKMKKGTKCEGKDSGCCSSEKKDK